MCSMTEDVTVCMWRVQTLTRVPLGVLTDRNPPWLAGFWTVRRTWGNKRSQNLESILHSSHCDSPWTIITWVSSALYSSLRCLVTVDMFALKSYCAFTSRSSDCAASEKASTLHFLPLTMHLELEFSPKQFDGTCSKAVALKALWIIHRLPVTDCMTAASTGIALFISAGFPRAWMRVHMWKSTHTHPTLACWRNCLARKLCASLPASCWDGLPLWLFEGVREKRLWWLWTPVWALWMSQLGCHSCRDISSGGLSDPCTHINTHSYKGGTLGLSRGAHVWLWM